MKVCSFRASSMLFWSRYLLLSATGGRSKSCLLELVNETGYPCVYLEILPSCSYLNCTDFFEFFESFDCLKSILRSLVGVGLNHDLSLLTAMSSSSSSVGSFTYGLTGSSIMGATLIFECPMAKVAGAFFVDVFALAVLLCCFAFG